MRKENGQLRKENEQLRKNNVDTKIKESIEKPKEIKSLEEDKNTTHWFDRNKFKELLAIIDSNKFNYRHRIYSVILKLKTSLIILKKIQLVKYLLKKV